MLFRPAFMNNVAAYAAAPAVAAMSLVLSDTDNSYLTRTWGASSTDGKKSTLALFFKYVGAAPSADRYIYDAGNVSGRFSWLQVDTANEIAHHYRDTGPVDYVITAADPVITDTSWHHLCISIDTTQA